MAQEYKGKPVFKGIALGPVTVLKKQDVQVKREKAGDPESEIKKVEEAVETSKEQLQHLYEKALSEVGEASAAIFEVHQMMLEDEDYQDAIRNMIRTEKVWFIRRISGSCRSFWRGICRARSRYVSGKNVMQTTRGFPWMRWVSGPMVSGSVR